MINLSFDLKVVMQIVETDITKKIKKVIKLDETPHDEMDDAIKYSI